MHIYLHSYRQCLMSTFQYLLWSSHSVQSLVVPTQRVVFYWYKSATVRGSCTSWMSLQLWWKSSMSLHRNRWKAVLVLSSLKTFSLSASLLRRLLDRFRYCFQGQYLANLWLFIFVWEVSVSSKTLSVSMSVPIAYQIQVVEARNRKVLPCETSPADSRGQQEQFAPGPQCEGGPKQWWTLSNKISFIHIASLRG